MKKKIHSSLSYLLLVLIIGLVVTVSYNVYAVDNTQTNTQSNTQTTNTQTASDTASTNKNLTISFSQESQLYKDLKISFAFYSKYGTVKFDNITGVTYSAGAQYNGKDVKYVITKVNGVAKNITFNSFDNAKNLATSLVKVSATEKYVEIEFETADKVALATRELNDLKSTLNGATSAKLKFKVKLTITRDNNKNLSFTDNSDPELSAEAQAALNVQKSLINCDSSIKNKKYSELTTFEDKFCYAKLNASETLSESDFDSNKKIKDTKIIPLECSKNPVKTDVTNGTLTYNYSEAVDSANNKQYDATYYQNANYYYGTYTRTVSLNHSYTYHYAPSDSSANADVQTQTATCDVTCEESVSVEYGPPVATKAGLCFEYKVKVISRTHCYGDNVTKPKHASVCLPAPNCIHADGMESNAAGPTEEFDSCIKSCDGGKYTKKCTNSCYKKVYGTTLTASIAKTESNSGSESYSRSSCVTRTNNLGSQTYTTQSGHVYPLNQHGCYYWTSGGTIKWYTNETYSNPLGSDTYYNKSFPYYGYWYIAASDNRKDFFQNNQATPGGNLISFHVRQDGDGFLRAVYGSDSDCNANCEWNNTPNEDDTTEHKCAKGDYLNVSDYYLDKIANTEEYNEAVKECSAYSKCASDTATFTIEADYTTDSGSQVKVAYPYTKDTDSANAKETLTSTKSGCTSNEPNSSMIRQFSGCYGNSYCTTDSSNTNTNKDSLTTRDYLTEWTFASWVNKKTGEISYTQKDSSAWRYKKNQFCLPRDVANVNSIWYHWYNKNYNNATINESCLTETEKTVLGNTTYTDPAGEDITYNILATTRNFGYFAWNFDISCFFATDKGDDSSDTTCSTTEYRIRTVSNDDLFPSDDGTSTGSSSTKTQGRETGYNWTEKSQLNLGVVPDSYAIDPSTYKDSIQSAGNTIYANATQEKYNSESSEVDYYFHLTPTDLKSIKAYNKQVSSYDSFCGDIVDVSTQTELTNTTKGVTAYYSSLFRNEISQTKYANGDCKGISTGVIKDSVKRKGNPKVNNDNNTTRYDNEKNGSLQTETDEQ